MFAAGKYCWQDKLIESPRAPSFPPHGDKEMAVRKGGAKPKAHIKLSKASHMSLHEPSQGETKVRQLNLLWYASLVITHRLSQSC